MSSYAVTFWITLSSPSSFSSLFVRIIWSGAYFSFCCLNVRSYCAFSAGSTCRDIFGLHDHHRSGSCWKDVQTWATSPSNPRSCFRSPSNPRSCSRSPSSPNHPSSCVSTPYISSGRRYQLLNLNHGLCGEPEVGPNLECFKEYWENILAY